MWKLYYNISHLSCVNYDFRLVLLDRRIGWLLPGEIQGERGGLSSLHQLLACLCHLGYDFSMFLPNSLVLMVLRTFATRVLYY